MTGSALLMLAAGITLIFAPEEISSALFHSSLPANILFAKILGALYFGFGMVNWTSRANLIGGIYARPIAIGNLTHFTVGALALVKTTFTQALPLLWIITGIYVLLAVGFGVVFFTHPLEDN